MIRYRHHIAALVTINAGLLFAGVAHAGTWQNQAPFGATLQGDLYTPTTPASPPAILVVIHMCTGHSSTVHPWFQSYADQYGFYLIAPDAGKQCFDASASRDGDKAAIVTMVNWVITNKQADKTRVFAAGMSSGGCMTNTLLAVYPDVFAGGSAMPGFPAGGWPKGDITCTKCGSQPPNMTAQQWGDLARNVFKWSGEYGCSQQWVGGGDQYNFNGWLPSVAAQFQNLSNLGAGTAGTGAPSGWTRTVYKDSAGNIRLETNLGPTSQMHDLETVNPPLYGNVVTFLGLDKPTGACGLSTTSTGGGGSGSSSSSGASTSGSTGTMSTSGATGSETTGGTTSGGGSTSTHGGSTSTGGHGTGSNGTSNGGSNGGGSGASGSGASDTGGSNSTPPEGTGGCSIARGDKSGVFGSIVAFAAAIGVLARRRRHGRSASMR
jgi:poly(hydroxyalkanoate) depolymerase family esterase